MPHHVQDSHLYYANARFHHNAPRSLHRPTDNKDSFIRMKCLLKSQLAQAQIPNMPAGFPLHYVADGHGSAFLSEGPYEFQQEMPLSSYGEFKHTQTAVISFSDPFSAKRSGKDHGKYVWRVSLPTFEPTQFSDVRVVSAEVQVDMAVMRSPFGERIRQDPRIISKALATSLEYGLKINIAIADYHLTTHFRGVSCGTSSGDIIYIGTTNDGDQQILNILDRRGYHAKFASTPSRSCP
ncbi:hypothetical protein DFP72DRAFT_1078967 [Ephemerocybe angulata]|uniref:Uncharacterized protein n=1 Tax=Ephemerocybe angulata TaxID=980116 RepID=A0A8H6HBP7_9AGAR|nr:hypothetical protein DFP72DRAFT_1078967 [Tulosesus angulatus]